MELHSLYRRFSSSLGLVLVVVVIAVTSRVPHFALEQSAAAGLANEFGVVGAVPSLPGDGTKQAAVDKIAEAGFGWMRHEFDIDVSSFEHYDAAHNKAKAKGIKTLGLLLFTGNDRGHDGWKSYVNKVVSHYGSDIPAWEIMNEADNYLSAADYVSYLKEAYDIIRGINAGATIVLTGITSRPETTSFWDGVAAAGGWGNFDVAGLHVYHSGNPEKVNFGGGDTSAEFDRAVAGLRKHGAKKIWITEMGYKVSEVGEANQANYLARTMILARANSQIDKVFVYRLFDDAKATYGLMGADLSVRSSYEAVKKLISYLGGAGFGTKLYPASQQTLDSLETVTGWSTQATSNGSTALSSVPGKTGNGMKIEYNFTAEKAYSIAEKAISVSGKPEAFAAWFYGDGTKNVWKFRYKDAKGETFQTDLGNIGGEWTYKQFIVEKDDAWVSWDGDGVIDYPISFNSFVIDRQGGEAAASGIVDELVAITGGADLFAYQFGSTVAYWKVSGTAAVELCGAKREFTESPNYATGVDCADAPKKAAIASQPPAPKPAASPKPKASPKPSPSPIPSPTPTPSPSPSPSPRPTPYVIETKAKTNWVAVLLYVLGILSAVGLSFALWYHRKTGQWWPRWSFDRLRTD